jgi:hypothetical protein
MEIEKMVENVENALQEANVSSDNLIAAIVKLLEIAHAHGADEEAKQALAECGITLEIAEE